MFEKLTCATFESTLALFLWYLFIALAATLVLSVVAGIVASVVIEGPSSRKSNGNGKEELLQREALTSLLAILLSLLSLPWWLGWVLTLSMCMCIVWVVGSIFQLGGSKYISRAARLIPPTVTADIVRVFDYIRKYVACLLNWCNQGQVRELNCLKELLGLPQEEREKRLQLICKLGNTIREMRNALEFLKESDKARKTFRERVEPLSQLPDFIAAVRPTLNEAIQERDKAVEAHHQRVKALSQAIFEQYRELHSHVRTIRPCEISIDALLAEAESTSKEALQVFENLR